MKTPTDRVADAITEALDNGRDVAEFVAHALCQVAAAEGGIEEVLRNRSGSWEAGHVRSLMEGTVGPDGEGLDAYRKAVDTEVYVAQLYRTQGGWRLEVRVPGTLVRADWPAAEFSGSDGIAPTVAERTEFLRELGYRPADSIGWGWDEVQESPDQAARFIAHVNVRSL